MFLPGRLMYVSEYTWDYSPLPPKDSVSSEAGWYAASLPFLGNKRKYHQADAPIVTKLAVTPTR